MVSPVAWAVKFVSQDGDNEPPVGLATAYSHILRTYTDSDSVTNPSNDPAGISSAHSHPLAFRSSTMSEVVSEIPWYFSPNNLMLFELSKSSMCTAFAGS